MISMDRRTFVLAGLALGSGAAAAPLAVSRMAAHRARRAPTGPHAGLKSPAAKPALKLLS